MCKLICALLGGQFVCSLLILVESFTTKMSSISNRCLAAEIQTIPESVQH